MSVVQVYAPQQGRPTEEKNAFYNTLQQVIDSVKYRGNTIVFGDWNGHVGYDRANHESIIGAYGIGDRNEEGRRILDFATVNGLSIMNT